MYKPLRPSQILKSESSVQSLVRVMETEYVNPFDSSLDKSRLTFNFRNTYSSRYRN